MAITTTQIITNPGVQWVPAGNAEFFTVTVPSGDPTVTCSSDPQGVNVLASITAGTTSDFANPGGFYASSPSVSGATVVACTRKLANLATFTTVKNTTSETVTAQLALPASILFNGSVLKVRTQITCSGVTATPTLQGALYFGAAGTTADTALWTAATTAILANGIQTGEFYLAVNAAPSAASAVAGTGSYALAGATGQTLINATLASTNFATNGVLYVTLTIKWSAASNSNVAAGSLFTVELL